MQNCGPEYHSPFFDVEPDTALWQSRPRDPHTQPQSDRTARTRPAKCTTCHLRARALRHRNVGVHTYKLLLDGRFRPAGPWPVRPARPQTTLDARQTQGGCRSVSSAPHASGIATPPVRTYSPAFSGAEGWRRVDRRVMEGEGEDREGGEWRGSAHPPAGDPQVRVLPRYRRSDAQS